jgi:hypothetical protein
MLILCNGMLLLNAGWDVLSAVLIWCTFCVKDVGDLELPSQAAATEPSLLHKLAGLHTSMWSRHVDACNHAACMLMGWWVLTLGCMRLAAALKREWLFLGLLSYAIEGLAFMVEGLKATMIARKACPAALFSLICLCIVWAAARL